MSHPVAVPATVMETVNPATGKPLATYPVTSAQALTPMVANAKSAQQVWCGVSLAHRAKVLRAMSQGIQAHVLALAQAIADETGKPLPEAIQNDAGMAAALFAYYANVGPGVLACRWMPPSVSWLMGRFHKQRRVPCGLVAVVAPWNFPLAIAASGISAALMAGNAVILKPSELTPGCSLQLVALLQDVLKAQGLPEALVQCAVGDEQTGAALVDSPIDYAIFTGSEATGRRIQASLAARHIGCSLELGGSCPGIILASAADLDAVTSYVLWSRFVNAGQACAGIKRLLVHQAHYEAVVALLTQKIEALQVGTQLGDHLGPLISAAQREKLHAQVEASVAAGASLVVGGTVPQGPGFFYPPTLLVDVPSQAPVLTEETFGPVLPVVSFKEDEEAITLANATPYGLTASVFGQTHHAQRVAQRLHAGVVAVNDTAMVNYGFCTVPWQGWKASGPGTSHGVDAILGCTRLQTVAYNGLFSLPLFRKQPWHFSKSVCSTEADFAQTVARFLAGGLWARLNPAMGWGLWQRRSQTRL